MFRRESEVAQMTNYKKITKADLIAHHKYLVKRVDALEEIILSFKEGEREMINRVTLNTWKEAFRILAGVEK